MAICANKIARIKHYEILETIGEGHFAKVKLAWHALTKRVVAIKVIQKTNQSLSRVKEQFREVDSLRTVNHPNIVKLLEVIETEETLFIVMEYVSGGDLQTYLEAKGRMTEGEARGLFCQLVSALQHCHQRGVVHRDLKLGNLLLDANNNIRISDFGLSNQWHPGKKLETFCGTPAFMAPELFLGMPYTGPEVDVWSLGVVLYAMVTGSLPFGGQHFWELRQSVLRGQYHVPKYLSTDLTDVIDRMLTLKPTNRGTLDDVGQHAWVNMGQEEPLPPACGDHPGVTVEMILGWCRDLIQGLDTRSVSDMNEPKMRVRTIKVRQAVCSDLTSQHHTPPASPEESILLPAWLWETTEQQENQESREKTRQPATPPPCPEARTVTPSPGPSTCNTHGESSAGAAHHAGDRHATRGTRLPCRTCGRRDSSHTRDTGLTRDARGACHTISTCDSCGPRGTSLTRDACSNRDTRLTWDPSLTRDAPSTQDTSLTWDPSLTPDACSTRNTSLTWDPSLTRDAPSTCNPTGASKVHDTRGNHDTWDTSATSDSCLTRDTRGTHDTDGTHGTCDTLNTSGTHDNSGKVAEGTHCLPAVPDAGSSTLVGQPDSMSPVTPSGLTQKKKGVAGRIWSCLSKYLCCGLPSKRANKVKPEING
ncbi:serine/threonine-protein kinase MARK2-like [Oryx dammah]|uniref:serine/threonine-protein kinase MARK2-like n=1 Tax=Oryx dammah TaxID=59534 RepID=UPI001A9B8730|nr:serine/threonine-protein kinase MARK2-like [Oryx dammah]